LFEHLDVIYGKDRASRTTTESHRDALEDVELATKNDISYDNSYDISPLALSNVVPPSSQVVKIAS